MGKVILYSTSTCHRCHAVKKVLDVNHVTYEEISDINIMKDKHFTEVPMMEVDGKTLDYIEIMTWLRENNYNLFGGDKDDSNT